MIKSLNFLLQLIWLRSITAAVTHPGGQDKVAGGYHTALAGWKAVDNGFASWTLNGVRLCPDGTLRLERSTAQAGSDAPGIYHGRNFYNGGEYQVGEAISLEMISPFAFAEAIVSWNASTPPGTWLEVSLRARHARGWTRWYNLGVWASGSTEVARHSVGDQVDEEASVSVDTLAMAENVVAHGYQARLRLFSTNDALPTVHGVWVAISSSKPQNFETTAPGNPALWNTRLDVPQCSQMVYPDGGNVWCSPTSVSMVLAYWQGEKGACEPRVRAAVDGVFDWIFDGHGNWPFNTAYAAVHTAGRAPLEGYVARFSGLHEAERWVAAGIPVIVSYAWKTGELTGAPVDHSSGHLGVLIGFDAAGNPILNDPAASDDAGVRRIYRRQEFENVWLPRSGGAVYLIYPQGWDIPK